MVENFVKDAIDVPRRAATDKFSIGCAQRVKDGVKEVLIISNKIEFINVNHVKSWAPDGFRVIGKRLNAATVGKGDSSFLRLKHNVYGKFTREG